MPETKKIDPALLDRLRAIVGPAGHIDDPADMEPYVAEWRGRYRGATPLVLRPASTQELSDLMRTCAEAGVPVVPQGGNTGLVGGSIPSADNSEVLISLSRMNKIREMDPLNYTVTVEAGCVLQTLQQAAADVDRLFPLSLGAEGTCQIGGNISANAGGTMTLRYGNMRDLVLGLEVVMPDGQVWDGMRRLRKNNTGYDLKHLFIGAQGTLGIVTADGTTRQHEIIVISTGFKVSEMAARLNITGREGKNLKQVWSHDNPTAYLGLTVPDFPNLFLMLGPNSGPAHGGSVIFQSECQSRYISACLVEMIENDIAAIDVDPAAHDEYIRNVDAEHEQLIWTHPGMTTYYRNSRGRVFSAMPWRFVDYWKMTHDPDFTQYRKTKARQET